MKRSALVLGAALIAAFAVMGAAATLGVSTKKVDSFTADQAATTTPTDTTPPTVTAREFFDTNTDGKIDQVRVTYDEILGTYAGTAGNWTLSTGRPSGMSANPATVQISGSQVLLGWTTLSTDAATAATMNLTLSSSAAVRDAAGNFAAAFSAQSVADKARPVPVSLTIANGTNIAGRPDQGDTVTITWSERLDEATICTGFDDVDTVAINGNSSDAKVEIKDDADEPTTTSDVLDATFACGLNFGSISLGSDAYVTATKTFAANANNDRSSATWNPTAKTFQLKLGATSAGDVATVSSSIAVYDPDDALADPAGNTVPSTTAPSTPFTISTGSVRQH